ncbi:cob(I)yrinic acid a,c-diamide adenosyltransferase [Xanthomonas euvesicatoria pv. eucalypti]|uniref:cob(I)yrinic acid a,c-diamide adenosyltransferase n=1 Tax=Xanthomonas euvesicatoria TaxID=456327 RepID=UPI0026E1F809|nr:cob(I)yrinic acid a,c-diamide adenosyltransferase [Xanthomonas euvesicatoria]MDO7946993.1 cob(I)yrinic acid a,c-diamide adenosyltransferase [Xanthomonas euvesicatoria pv. eucalypti]MDO7954086.1 cob(I)yrinic acid a,c-diamide adenosyltransferase [Xanthomonas euvesicatoria pv. eucalypti]MDO7959355.1 cob(I)yrinic acid a,c-diamide adenosyltransferase [Xanthomonas euvesicatoria pv. eucalypti]MDO7961902.1 cob(I)yrinic acid a,c-diamide adenosyltransferase [Xanthomonas euvesicatoria pv. eucalypti]
MTAPEHDEAHYRERAQRKKELVDRRIARAVIDRGVLLVNTGNGKGKSSSGFGMLARSLGHGLHCGVVQFIKGTFSTGEEAFFRRFPDLLDYHVMGEGFTWETQDRARDIAAAQAAWQRARGMLADARYDFVLLDELNIALVKDYIALDVVLAAVGARPPGQHVVITGRGAPAGLIELADTVTEMRLVKHAFNAGIKAQLGIEL